MDENLSLFNSLSEAMDGNSSFFAFGDMHTIVVEIQDSFQYTWIRSFIGRIVKLECSNKFVEQRFYGDLKAMRELYGGTSDAVQ